MARSFILCCKECLSITDRRGRGQFIAIFVAAGTNMPVGEGDIGYPGVSVITFDFVVCSDIVIKKLVITRAEGPHVKIVIVQKGPGPPLDRPQIFFRKEQYLCRASYLGDFFYLLVVKPLAVTQVGIHAVTVLRVYRNVTMFR